MPRKPTQRNTVRHMPIQKSSPHRETWGKLRQSSRPTLLKHETESKFDDEDTYNDNSDSDTILFGWEEEAALLSELMEEVPPQTEAQQNDALVESLLDPFSTESKHIKKEIATTFVPAANRVKAAYQALDQHVDTTYGKGTVQFNKACVEIETTMAIEQTEFQKAYQATQEKIEILFEQLKDQYAVRDQLWVDVKTAIDEIVTPAIEQLKDTPASIERTIVKLEKKSESLEKHKDSNKNMSLANEFLKKML